MGRFSRTRNIHTEAAILLLILAICKTASAIRPDGSPILRRPAPVAKSIAPAAMTAGSAAFNVQVIGSNFAPSSLVFWKAVRLKTAYVSATQLIAYVPDTLIVYPGTATIKVVTLRGGSSNGLTFTVNSASTPPPKLAITSTSLPGATATKSYSAALAATGGRTPYVWSPILGALPPGLALATSGQITGAPTLAGQYSFTVRAADAASPAQTATAQMSITVASVVAPLMVSTTALPSGKMGIVYAANLNASGGTAPYLWNLSAGSLPAGLSLVRAGQISGTPTAAGTYDFTVVAADAGSPVHTASAQFSIAVAPAAPPIAIVTSSLPSGRQNTSYSATLAATGGTPGYTWGLPSGSLPPGLTLAATSGQITGSPSVVGTYTFTVGTTDSASPAQTTSKSLSISVGRWPSIGINMSEAEYSWGSFPSDSDLAYLQSKNISLIRLPIAWERAQPTLGGPLDPTYLAALKAFINAAGTLDMQVIVDVHNYGRYNSHWAQDAAANYGYVAVGNGDIIGSAAVPISAFADLWTKLAGALKGTPGLAYYDIMNEPHDMGGTNVWPSAAQAAVNAIRSVDMNTSILVEGTQWASARWWPWDNGNLRVTDPANKLLYEAHLYCDSNGSGTYSQSYAQSGAYPNVCADRLQPFLTWLTQNNAKGFLGEFGVPGNDPQWLPVLDNLLTALQAAGLSGTYWNYTFHSVSDPSWWPADDPMSIRLDNGQANPQMDLLLQHNTALPAN